MNKQDQLRRYLKTLTGDNAYLALCAMKWESDLITSSPYFDRKEYQQWLKSFVKSAKKHGHKTPQGNNASGRKGNN